MYQCGIEGSIYSFSINNISNVNMDGLTQNEFQFVLYVGNSLFYSIIPMYNNVISIVPYVYV